MKPNTILQRMVILLITLMCAIGANADEAYACYTSSNTTLTFYYDNLRNSRDGTTYDLNTGDENPGWDTDGTKAYVTKVVFHWSFGATSPTTTYAWFYAMRQLQSIEGLSYLNTSNVTNMAYMFMYCVQLKSLYLSDFNTANVTNMMQMFYGCTSLQTIYVGSNWSTAAVTSSANMFNNCTSLVGGRGTTIEGRSIDKTYAQIDGGSNNPGYFTALGTLAYACYTESNTTLTFYYDDQRNSRSGTTYNLNTGATDTRWDTDGTKANVTKVVFDPSFVGARPTSTYDWFYNMANLQSIQGLNYLNTSEVTNMAWMFGYCSSLKSLDLSSFNTAIVTNMDYMFNGCTSLQTIYVTTRWRTNTVSSSLSMFSDCSSLKGGRGTTWNSSNPTDKTYAHIDGVTNSPGYLTGKNEMYACYTRDNSTLTFYYDFYRSDHDDQGHKTYGGLEIRFIDKPGWSVMGAERVVFDPSFAEARPTSTKRWFEGMLTLKSIDGMKYLNTSEVTDMAAMFKQCYHLIIIDLSNFDTSNVTNMHSMFKECYNVVCIDLSSFNTAKLSMAPEMFQLCHNLQTIYVGSGWTTTALTYSVDMFTDCDELKGGKGTTWKDTNPTDKTYARIDGGTSNPGYFTYKGSSGITTDLHQVTSDKSQVTSDEWYTIDGRKLNGMPAKKGVYIHNGRAVVL